MSDLAKKAIQCCRDLALCSEEPGRTTRTFLSPPMHDVHRVLGAWMRQAGMEDVQAGLTSLEEILRVIA